MMAATIQLLEASPPRQDQIPSMPLGYHRMSVNSRSLNYSRGPLVPPSTHPSIYNQSIYNHYDSFKLGIRRRNLLMLINTSASPTDDCPIMRLHVEKCMIQRHEPLTRVSSQEILIAISPHSICGI